MNTQDIVLKLRRLHTLLVLGKRSNNLALAIRRALDAIAAWPEDVCVMVQKTPIRILFAGYGPKFIKIFDELMRTGDIAMIHQLQPEFDPFFCYLCEIPGIGETMARRMYFDRSIRSMDDLRIAYSNNILQRIPSFGDIRLKAIEDILWISQTREASSVEIPRVGMPSQLALPAVYPQTEGNILRNKSEYTQSYGQSYATFSSFEGDAEEEDLFSPTSQHVQASGTMHTLSGGMPSKELFPGKEDKPSQMMATGQVESMSHVDLRTLPGTIPGEKGGMSVRIDGAPVPSLPVYHTTPSVSVTRMPLGQPAQDIPTSARPSEVHEAVSRTILAPKPEDALVKSQLEAFIARDLAEHGILPISTEPRRDSVLNVGHEAEGRKDSVQEIAPRMANAVRHSSAELAYEAEGRKDSVQNIERTPSGTVLRVETLVAHELVVDELVVTLLKTQVLVAESVLLDRRMPELTGDVQADMTVDKISASVVYADSVTAEIVRAKRVRARYLMAQLTRG